MSAASAGASSLGPPAPPDPEPPPPKIRFRKPIAFDPASPLLATWSVLVSQCPRIVGLAWTLASRIRLTHLDGAESWSRETVGAARSVPSCEDVEIPARWFADYSGRRIVNFGKVIDGPMATADLLEAWREAMRA